jgi:hypothetical protein
MRSADVGARQHNTTKPGQTGIDSGIDDSDRDALAAGDRPDLVLDLPRGELPLFVPRLG